MDKVMIIGSGGLLGSALAREFSSGYDVVELDRGKVDISDTELLTKLIAEHRPRYLVNAAAYNGVDAVESDPAALAEAEEVNARAVGRLARAAAGVPVVHFSTDYVFSGDNPDGYAEAAQPAPINKYGETKLTGERLLRENTPAFYLIRLSRLFGPPGASPRAKKSFVDLMLDLARQGKQELTLVNEEISAPTYSPDAAWLVREILEKKRPYGIYHGANTGGCSWFELAEAVFALSGFPVKLTPIPSSGYPRPARRPLHSVLLNTKLPPARHWRDALEDYV